VYLDRFQDSGGVNHPEWVSFFSPYSVSINRWSEETLRQRETDMLASWDGSEAADERSAQLAQAPAPPTAAAILDAIATQPPEVERLFVHLIGMDASGGVLQLSPTEHLSAVALNSALDTFELTHASSVDPAVILLVDAPGSGSFLEPCAGPQGGRVVMTSGRAWDGALFLDAPLLTSFSRTYLASAWKGNTAQDAFGAGRSLFEELLGDYLATPVRPQIDTNGDGVFDSSDLAPGNLASRVCVGRRSALAGDSASDLPFIVDVCSTQTLAPDQPVTLWARLVEGVEPVRVFAQIVPPDLDTSSGAVSFLPEIELARDPGTPSPWTWSASYPAPSTPGSHRIAFYATYPDGAAEKLTSPAFTSVVVTGVPVPDGWWVR